MISLVFFIRENENMEANLKKVRNGLFIFGLFCLAYNIWEFIASKYSTKQGIIFIVESLLGIALIFLPTFLEKVLKIQVSNSIVYFYWFFLSISVFLGTALHMISIIYFWDKILHLVSPMLLTAVGYGIAGFFLRNTDKKNISPWFFLLFGFAFAGLCGVFWEFWEFLCDSVGNMNLQRYNMSNGTPFIGREALMDTMGDLFTNTIGALLMGIFSYIKSKKNPNYFDNYIFQKSKL